MMDGPGVTMADPGPAAVWLATSAGQTPGGGAGGVCGGVMLVMLM